MDRFRFSFTLFYILLYMCTLLVCQSNVAVCFKIIPRVSIFFLAKTEQLDSVYVGWLKIWNVNIEYL